MPNRNNIRRNLGAILFARDITIFPLLQTKSTRVVKYIGVDKRKSEPEIEGRKGYAVGFPGLLSYIKKQLPQEEVYHRGLRRSVSTYSEIAIREVVANALIHQDFTVSGAAPLIEIYDDRIEIINPGHSLIQVDRIIDERRSRNEKLAAIMRELGNLRREGRRHRQGNNRN